jgi:hypothetical protein
MKSILRQIFAKQACQEQMVVLEWLHGSLAARAVMEQWLDREQSVQG